MVDAAKPLVLTLPAVTIDQPSTALVVSGPAALAPTGTEPAKRFLGIWPPTPRSPFRAQLGQAQKHLGRMHSALEVVRKNMGRDEWVLKNAVPAAAAFGDAENHRAEIVATLSGLTEALSHPVVLGATIAHDADGRGRYSALLAGLAAADVRRAALETTVGFRSKAVAEARASLERRVKLQPTEQRLSDLAAMEPEARRQIEASITAVRRMGLCFGTMSAELLSATDVLPSLARVGQVQLGTLDRHYGSEVMRNVTRTIDSVGDLRAVLDELCGQRANAKADGNVR